MKTRLSCGSPLSPSPLIWKRIFRLGLRQWCVTTFESPLDMVYRLSKGKDYLSDSELTIKM